MIEPSGALHLERLVSQLVQVDEISGSGLRRWCLIRSRMLMEGNGWVLNMPCTCNWKPWWNVAAYSSFYHDGKCKILEYWC